jgi:hypothetical protein
VHASGFAGHPASAAKRTSYAENEIVSWFLSFSFHGLLSIKTGRSPELSYTRQESASLISSFASAASLYGRSAALAAAADMKNSKLKILIVEMIQRLLIES